MVFHERNILSRPHPVHWAGFRSDTRTLQDAGWEFSAEQRVETDSVGLVMRHGAYGIHAVTCTVPNMMYDLHPQALQQFHIQYLTDRGIQFQTYQMPDWVASCKPVDMMPQMVEVKSIEDMNMFAGVMVRNKEIIVEPEDVSTLMDRILELQKPEAKAHYERVLREQQKGHALVRDGAGPRQQFHAQVISLVA